MWRRKYIANKIHFYYSFEKGTIDIQLWLDRQIFGAASRKKIKIKVLDDDDGDNDDDDDDDDDDDYDDDDHQNSAHI